MKITNIPPKTGHTFTQVNFPAAEFFNFGGDLYIVLSWSAAGALVHDLMRGSTLSFVESKYPDYSKVDVQEIIYSIA